MSGGTVRLEGMRELRGGLRKLSTDNAWRGALREVYATIAQVVQNTARSKASSTRMGSAAVGAIKGKGTTTNATLIAFAGKTGAYGPGFEWGSSGAFPQFVPRTPGGKSLYPAVAEESPRIQAEVLDAIDFALAETFPD